MLRSVVLTRRADPSALTPDRTDQGGASRRTAVILSLLAVYGIWGSTYFALSVVLRGFPPFGLAALRFAIAGSLLYGVLRLRGAPRPSRIQWIAAAKVGMLLLVAGNGAVTFAQQWVSSSLAAIVVSSMPIWATVFAALWGARPSKRELAGLVVGFGGVVLLNLGGELRAHGPAALALLLAPVAWAFGSIWGKRLPQPSGPMAPATHMLVSAVVLGLISVVAGEAWPRTVEPVVLGAFLYLTLFGSLVALIAYAYLLHNTRASIATSYAYVNPLIAVALGVGFNGESIAVATWIAGAVIVAGVVLVIGGPRVRPEGAAERDKPRR